VRKLGTYAFKPIIIHVSLNVYKLNMNLNLVSQQTYNLLTIINWKTTKLSAKGSPLLPPTAIGYESVPKIIINNTINLFFKLQST